MLAVKGSYECKPISCLQPLWNLTFRRWTHAVLLRKTSTISWSTICICHWMAVISTMLLESQMQRPSIAIANLSNERVNRHFFSQVRIKQRSIQNTHSKQKSSPSPFQNRATSVSNVRNDDLFKHRIRSILTRFRSRPPNPAATSLRIRHSCLQMLPGLVSTMLVDAHSVYPNWRCLPRWPGTKISRQVAIEHDAVGRASAKCQWFR